MPEHIPVLLQEVLFWLRPERGGRFLDGTLGLGGHAHAILERGGGRVRIIGIDRDQSALEAAEERLRPYGSAARLYGGTFDRFPEFLEDAGWDGLEGALLDLGVSSMQLDDPERGFSFIQDGPLDMRMGSEPGGASAAELVNRGSLEQLKRIIYELGEEPMGGRIARAIVDARQKKPFETTLELAGTVERAYPAARRAKSRNHPATKTFQALRMAVNRELECLDGFLGRIFDFLTPGGRVAVISFHSLEDRMVKHAFRRSAKGCICPVTEPRCVCGGEPLVEILTKKPITSTEDEVRSNPRSRSAKLRVAQKRQRGTG
jgi:16S rRNA (cytosine1402-N4)-methyltransferase